METPPSQNRNNSRNTQFFVALAASVVLGILIAQSKIVAVAIVALVVIVALFTEKGTRLFADQLDKFADRIKMARFTPDKHRVIVIGLGVALILAIVWIPAWAVILASVGGVIYFFYAAEIKSFVMPYVEKTKSLFTRKNG